jgi:hypothetical protein
VEEEKFSNFKNFKNINTQQEPCVERLSAKKVQVLDDRALDKIQDISKLSIPTRRLPTFLVHDQLMKNPPLIESSVGSFMDTPCTLLKFVSRQREKGIEAAKEEISETSSEQKVLKHKNGGEYVSLQQIDPPHQTRFQHP